IFGHTWPLNVRELEQALAVGCATGADSLHAQSLGLAQPPASGQTEPPPTDLVELSLDEATRREQMLELVEQCAGNISEISRRTCRARPLIRRWLRRYGIDVERYRAGT